MAVVFVPMDVGVIATDGVCTMTGHSLPSEIVSVPVPDPVVTLIVAEVVKVTVCDAMVQPETPLIENGEPDQLVPVRVNVIVILPPWPLGIIVGLATRDGMPTRRSIQSLRYWCP